VLRVILTVLTLSHGSDGLPAKAPDAVGMSSSRLEAIDRVVQRGISAGGYPGASVVVGRKGAAVWEKGFGKLSWSPVSPVVDADKTIYDIASLSKVVGTTTAIMLLYDEKKVDLDAPVLRYLPAFSGGLKDQVTVRERVGQHFAPRKAAVHRQRQRDRGIQVRARHSRRHITPHRHRKPPGDVDRQVRAGRLFAQNDLGDDADAEDDQDERAEELGERFAEERS